MNEPDRELRRRPKAWVFVPTLVAGWAIIGFGIHAARHNARDAHPVALVVHVVGFDLAHDVLIAPLLFLGGWALGAVVPKVGRGPVRAAAATTALLVVFAFPLLRGWGRRATNSSTLPLNYGRNLAIVVAVVWILTAAVIAYRVRTKAGDERV